METTSVWLNSKFIKLALRISVKLCRIGPPLCWRYAKWRVRLNYYVIVLYRVGHEKVARLPFCKCPCDILSGDSIYSILHRVSEQLVNSRAVTMYRYTRCNIVILMAATVWLMLSFSSCIVCGFDSYTVLFKCPQRNWSTTSATQLQPSKSLCYIGYTWTWLDVRSCLLM